MATTTTTTTATVAAAASTATANHSGSATTAACSATVVISKSAELLGCDTHTQAHAQDSLYDKFAEHNSTAGSLYNFFGQGLDSG